MVLFLTARPLPHNASTLIVQEQYGKDDARNLLGISPEASEEEIKAAYRRSANKARERLQRERSQKKRESEKRKLDSDFDALVEKHNYDLLGHHRDQLCSEE
jgi:DnaJ-class molecular chaperone